MSIFNTIQFIANHPLNRHARSAALLRYIRWQIGSRLVSGAVVHDWINGARFLVRPGETGLTGNIYVGLLEFQDMAFLLHFLRGEDLFVDVGANLGSYTILASFVAGVRSIAFEPVPSTYDRLMENMRLNAITERVDCINKGVGAGKDVLRFTSGSDTTNHALADGEQCESTVTVETTSLDIALQGKSPTLLKIDVEGYETQVLEGASETLANRSLRAVIMELNGGGSHYGFDESRLLEKMYEYDFRAYSYDPFSRRLASLEGKNQNIGNTLFLRDRSSIDERLGGAAKVSIFGTAF